MCKKQNFVRISLYGAIAAAVLAFQVSAQQVILIGSYADIIKIGVETAFPMDGNYELTQHIDASASRTANGGMGHLPIGQFGVDADDSVRTFRGTFDGKGYAIRGLYINRPNADYVGFFGAIGGDAVIKDLILEAELIAGRNYVGVIAGRSVGNINVGRCEVKGTVNGVVGVGGLFGEALGSIQYSGFEGIVNGDTLVGGLVGQGNGVSINNSYFSGTVNGIHRVGGVAGEYSSIFGRLNTSGAINGVTNVGGLFGQYNHRHRSYGSSSHSTAAVNGDTAVGGLIGSASNFIDSSYATGDVNGKVFVGGLIGRGYAGVENSHATGAINGIEYVGGLAGNLSGSISSSYALGTVKGSRYVGGLVGMFDNDNRRIERSYAAGAVETGAVGGGLVGRLVGETIDSYSVSDVTGREGSIGGLVGVNAGRIERCYSVGRVRFENPNFRGHYIGGLIGNNASGSVTASFFNAEISGQPHAVGSGTAPNAGVVTGTAGRTTAEMKSQLNFSGGWNFGNIWAASGHYPHLRNFPIQRLTYSAGTNGTIMGGVDHTIIQIVNRGAAHFVIAVPDSGFYFVEWSDGLTSAERADRLPESDTISVTARFGLMYTLTYRAGENGILVGDTLQFVLDGNSAATIIAVPNEGYAFFMWSDSVMSARRTDIGVSSNIAVYAIFREFVSVRHRYANGTNRPLMTLRGNVLAVNADAGASVHVRVVNLTGRTVASFKTVGRTDYSLRRLPAGAYLVEARRDGGQRMTMPVVLR
jgi:hypothetical protein